MLLPGGGSYANFIRKMDVDLNLGDDRSHWMAIYSMNYNGQNLKKNYPNIQCIEDLKEFRNSNKIISIFLPFKYFYKNDTLAHSWDVTSDSIALYICYKLNLNQCFLIKNIDGIYNSNGKLVKNVTTVQYSRLKKTDKLAKIGREHSNLKKSKPIDSNLLKLLDQTGISCYILNGSSNHQRIVEFFNSEFPIEKKIYTKICKPTEINRYE
jgi:aspartokinase-like uncharacterized kinase